MEVPWRSADESRARRGALRGVCCWAAGPRVWKARVSEGARRAREVGSVSEVSRTGAGAAGVERCAELDLAGEIDWLIRDRVLVVLTGAALDLADQHVPPSAQPAAEAARVPQRLERAVRKVDAAPKHASVRRQPEPLGDDCMRVLDRSACEAVS